MKKYIFTTILLLLSYYTLCGQISTREKPVSFRKSIPALKNNERTQKRLPLLGGSSSFRRMKTQAPALAQQ